MTLRSLAFPVKVPDWLGEELGDVWTFPLDSIPYMVRGADIGFTTFECSSNAEQTDEVTVVRVEELTCMTVNTS